MESGKRSKIEVIKMGASRRELIGEVVGTFILVFFGLGSVALEVATNVSLGLPVIALVWGAAVALAIYVVGPLSGAHINSAMTLAFALWNDFPWRKVPAYVGAQFVGAMLGAMAVYGFFRGAISKFEVTAGIVRGEPGSEASAKIFGEYFGDAPLLKAMIWEGSGHVPFGFWGPLDHCSDAAFSAEKMAAGDGRLVARFADLVGRTGDAGWI